VLPTKATTCSW